jgi:hypothetical protein
MQQEQTKSEQIQPSEAVPCTFEYGLTDSDAIQQQIKLIRKLRWIGMEDAAQKLIDTLPVQLRPNLFGAPCSTTD